MDGQTGYQALGKIDLRSGGIGLVDTRKQGFTDLNNLTDLRVGFGARVASELIPVGVVRKHTWLIGRHHLLHQGLHLPRQATQYLALLNTRAPHALEGIDVVRVHWEHAHKLVEAFVHAVKARGELLQVLADPMQLLSIFFEQTFGDDIFDIVTGDQHLFGPVTDAFDFLGGECELRAIEDGFLHTADETETGTIDNFTHHTHHGHIQRQLLLITRAQVIEDLVTNQQQTLVGIALVKQRHHLFKVGFMIG